MALLKKINRIQAILRIYQYTTENRWILENTANKEDTYILGDTNDVEDVDSIVNKEKKKILQNRGYIQPI